MRIWSLHPGYLDRQGLTACWRESLLAQAVLAGHTQGYTNHSQLLRFRERPEPLAAIGAYLSAVAAEAAVRSQRFDRTRIIDPPAPERPAMPPIRVADGQIAYEWAHLMAKLRVRSPDRAANHAQVDQPTVHPFFTVIPGPIASWERT